MKRFCQYLLLLLFTGSFLYLPKYQWYWLATGLACTALYAAGHAAFLPVLVTGLLVGFVGCGVQLLSERQ